jgi:hypothetical protein
MKRQYNAPETTTMEVAMQNHLAFGTVTNLENNGDAATREYSLMIRDMRNEKQGTKSLWEEEEEE